MARGGGAAGGLQLPYFFENYRVTAKKCFQHLHFESLASPPSPPYFQSICSSAVPVFIVYVKKFIYIVFIVTVYTLQTVI